MGNSGEGKSTLLHILGTLEAPTSGMLMITGNDALAGSHNRIRNKNIGFVFQNFHLLDHYSALDNVLMPARIAGMNTKKGSTSYLRGQQLLEEVGLDNRAVFPVQLLSGGEKQRVALARALCNDPDIILADEPSGNLDDKNSSQIYRLLLNFSQKHHKALIVVTHDPLLANLCSRVFLLKQGALTDITNPSKQGEEHHGQKLPRTATNST